MPTLRPFVLTKTKNGLKQSAETTWCQLEPPSNYPKPLKTTQEIPDITWYQPQCIFFTKNELFFSAAALMLCLKVIFGQI